MPVYSTMKHFVKLCLCQQSSLPFANMQRAYILSDHTLPVAALHWNVSFLCKGPSIKYDLCTPQWRHLAMAPESCSGLMQKAAPHGSNCKWVPIWSSILRIQKQLEIMASNVNPLCATGYKNWYDLTMSAHYAFKLGQTLDIDSTCTVPGKEIKEFKQICGLIWNCSFNHYSAACPKISLCHFLYLPQTFLTLSNKETEDDMGNQKKTCTELLHATAETDRVIMDVLLPQLLQNVDVHYYLT